MFLARVEGHVVATKKHKSFEGWKLTICQPVSASGEPEGPPLVAVDPHGANQHQLVIISSDGLATRRLVSDDKSPARWILVGVVDESARGPREDSESSSAGARASGGGAPLAVKKAGAP